MFACLRIVSSFSRKLFCSRLEGYTKVIVSMGLVGMGLVGMVWVGMGMVWDGMGWYGNDMIWDSPAFPVSLSSDRCTELLA